MVASRSAGREWVLLAYRLPREPSTPRIAVWRRLKRLGVAQLLDGLVGLPLTAQNREQLEWVAESVVEAKGEATVWIGHVASRADEDRLIGPLRDRIADEYRVLIAQVETAELTGTDQRATSRLQRELRRITDRDHFPPPEADEARRALDRLAGPVEVEP
jgi:hypothetical protein